MKSPLGIRRGRPLQRMGIRARGRSDALRCNRSAARCPDQRSNPAVNLPTPRRAFPVQVFIHVDTLPDASTQAPKFQETPARLAFDLSAESAGELGNEAQLVTWRECFHS